MTTLHITWPPRHPRENPSLRDIADAIQHDTKSDVEIRNAFPGPRIITPADKETVEAIAAFYLDPHHITWRAS